MADEGFVLLWRKAFSHGLWREKRALSRWEAWTDLWANQAAFTEHSKIVGGQSIVVARGQLVASQRFLADRWHWSVGKVRRFLAYLKAQDMMRDESRMNAGRTETDIGMGTLYTIVNYPLLQDLQAAIVSATNRQRTSNGPKIKKGKKGIEDSTDVESGWSKPAATVWKKHMGGTIPPVRLNVALSPLVAEHGAEEMLKWWGKYLSSSTAAQFKTPENFAQRFGAWRREHSTNGCSVEDIRRCLHLGGSLLAMQVSREDGFTLIRDNDPALWERAQLVLLRLDFPYLLKLAAGKNGYELDRAIKNQLEPHD